MQRNFEVIKKACGSGFSEGLLDVLRKMLEVDFHSRKSAKELIVHPYFTKNDIIKVPFI